jgi:peptidyl-prolyl cis-trans isomerase C
MKAPTGQELKADAATSAGSRTAAAFGTFARFALAALASAWRALAKLVMTIWRLAGALDSALWRGVKLSVRIAWRAGRIVAAIILRRAKDFAAWLPSRSGRAYSAFSGVVLLVALLWIADELRAAQAATLASGDLFVAPIDAADPILARIEGRYVHLSEVESAALASGALQPGEALTPEAAFKRNLVEAFVEQRLLSRAATEAGIHRDPAISRKLAAARDRILAGAFMEKEIADAVTDEAVRGLYDRNVDVTRLGEAVKSRHIVVATEEEAREILFELAAGGDFAAIARERSLDRATGPQGGATGYLTRDQMTPAFAEAAFSTPEGELAEPFFTDFGWNILEVVDRRRTGGVPFASVADGIRRFLRLKTIEATLTELKDRGDVVYFPAEEAEAVEAPPLRDAPPGG